MKWYRIFFIILLCNNCKDKPDRNLTITIDGLFTASEIGLAEKGSIIKEKYFSIYLTNKDTSTITIATTGDGNFYSPIYINYTYFSIKHNKRNRGGGAPDFFSSQKTMIHPSQSRKFHFYASISPNTDTVAFVFQYNKRDQICYIETSHFLKNDKVLNLINYQSFCE